MCLLPWPWGTKAKAWLWLAGCQSSLGSVRDSVSRVKASHLKSSQGVLFHLRPSVKTARGGEDTAETHSSNILNSKHAIQMFPRQITVTARSWKGLSLHTREQEDPNHQKQLAQASLAADGRALLLSGLTKSKEDWSSRKHHCSCLCCFVGSCFFHPFNLPTLDQRKLNKYINKCQACP